jgi:hypothetical protein
VVRRWFDCASWTHGIDASASASRFRYCARRCGLVDGKNNLVAFRRWVWPYPLWLADSLTDQRRLVSEAPSASCCGRILDLVRQLAIAFRLYFASPTKVRAGNLEFPLDAFFC